MSQHYEHDKVEADPIKAKCGSADAAELKKQWSFFAVQHRIEDEFAKQFVGCPVWAKTALDVAAASHKYDSAEAAYIISRDKCAEICGARALVRDLRIDEKGVLEKREAVIEKARSAIKSIGGILSPKLAMLMEAARKSKS